ncbi:hypothetical protein CDAR_185261 [Caerostris darwini]|uniref:Uncharacterized protein n=1 Tax=Caerostris darwini TaxID=1538125 RepID=A0AAV4SS17_9ARAC|nr:hypothetical protein CDAR_185261 [Caerostris darwini]
MMDEGASSMGPSSITLSRSTMTGQSTSSDCQNIHCPQIPKNFFPLTLQPIYLFFFLLYPYPGHSHSVPTISSCEAVKGWAWAKGGKKYEAGPSHGGSGLS